MLHVLVTFVISPPSYFICFTRYMHFETTTNILSMITQNRNNRGNGVSPNLFPPCGEEHRNLAVKVENVKKKNTQTHEKHGSERATYHF